jgi:Family of unknown function (DUF5923)
VAFNNSPQTATSKLCVLLELFANSKSTDIIFDAVNALIDDAEEEETLCIWMKDINANVCKVIFI